MRAFACLLTLTAIALAQPDAEPEVEPADADEGIKVFGNAGKRARSPGAGQVVDEADLEIYEYDDIHRVLQQTPGVYVRDEEGFGLRPNIGLRGASSERSAKITLMEDGILLAPAPYAAPAAYYFPQTTRMVAVEVFKGPSSVEYGPNTIGGALNLVTRPVPDEGHAGMVDLAGGQRRSGKVHAWYGQSLGDFGLLAEAVHLRSDGFKSLDGGGDTGFDKNELMLKLRHRIADGATRHRVSVKLGYADERSSETYLGLSDDDFEADPYRRYAASQRGRMEWDRTQVALRYVVDHGDDLDLELTLYRHDFQRGWRKLNGFGGAHIADVLRNPDSGRSAVFFAILRGDEDSTPGVPEESLRVGTNLRDYVSQGVQLGARWRYDGKTWFNELRVGLRLHQDEIERAHTEGGFQMRSGVLVPEAPGDPEPDVTADNRGRALALAAHVVDEYAPTKGLYFTPGVRLEVIRTSQLDRLDDGAETAADDVVVVPGVGVYWQAAQALGLLAGVHRGFSAVAPGQPGAVDPETSTNYEAGVRFGAGRTKAELLGFFNDYDNLTSECTFSMGCDAEDLNAQLNAGEVYVYGAELTASQRVAVAGDFTLELALNYTLTLSEFRTAFSSVNPQLGEVEEGDALPYVPQHQLNARLALMHASFGLYASATHTSEMRDVAGQGAIPDEERVDAHTLLDAGLSWYFAEADEVYLRVDNLLDTEYVASRRPLGARPGKPLSVFAGYKHRFEGP